MKTLMFAAAIAALSAAAPAFAQDVAPTWKTPQVYANIGYSQVSPNGHDLGEVTGRMGLKMGRYFGIEGEYGRSVTDRHYNNAAGVNTRISEINAPAGYGVVFLPLLHDRVELIGRGGYGNSEFKFDTLAGNQIRSYTSINYGGGAQVFLDGKNGVRADYTRRDYQGTNAPRDDDTYTVSYVHRF